MFIADNRADKKVTLAPPELCEFYLMKANAFVAEGERKKAIKFITKKSIMVHIIDDVRRNELLASLYV